MFKNKKELTRVESFALSIVQWCIHCPEKEMKDNWYYFFSQITISTVHPKDLKRIAMALNNRGESGCYGHDPKVPGTRGQEMLGYKALKLKAYITEMNKANWDTRNYTAEAEFFFENLNGKWYPYATHVNFNSHLSELCSFFCHKGYPFPQEKFPMEGAKLKRRELCFHEFASEYSRQVPIAEIN